MSHLQLEYKTFLEEILEKWKTKTSDTRNFCSEVLKTVFEKLLEIEREEFLKNCKEGKEPNKANGFYERFVKLISGKMKISVPRDRINKFKPLALEIMKEDQGKMEEIAFSLYSKGLSVRDIESFLKEIYEADFSPQSISDMTNSFKEIKEQWDKRKLDGQYLAVFIDAIHINIRRETVDNEAIYVVLGLKENCTREVLGLYSIPQESSSGWKEVLIDLRTRGIKNIKLFIADGLTGLENSINEIYPSSLFQKCVVHLKRNILNKARSKDKREISNDLKEIFDLTKIDDSEEKALMRFENFKNKWSKIYPTYEKMLNENIIRYYFTYLKLPYQIRRMIYTTNWIERLNKEIRKVVKNKNSFPTENSALLLIWSKIIEFEEKVYKFKINSFYEIKDDFLKIN